jgi:transcriptional regulator with XRE-family HTH domain
MRDIPEIIKQYLKDEGISISSVAEKMDKNKQSLYDVFSKKKKMNIELYIFLCEAIGVDAKFFFGCENGKNNPNVECENTGFAERIDLNTKKELELLRQILEEKNDHIKLLSRVVDSHLDDKNRGENGTRTE